MLDDGPQHRLLGVGANQRTEAEIQAQQRAGGPDGVHVAGNFVGAAGPCDGVPKAQLHVQEQTLQSLGHPGSKGP